MVGPKLPRRTPHAPKRRFCLPTSRTRSRQSPSFTQTITWSLGHFRRAVERVTRWFGRPSLHSLRQPDYRRMGRAQHHPTHVPRVSHRPAAFRLAAGSAHADGILRDPVHPDDPNAETINLRATANNSPWNWLFWENRNPQRSLPLLEELRRDDPAIGNRVDHEAVAMSVAADPQAVLDAIKDNEAKSDDSPYHSEIPSKS